MVDASRLRKLNWYPDTFMAIGSPSGAIRSTLISSPGKHPISINLTDISRSVNSFTIPFSPTSSCESLIYYTLTEQMYILFKLNPNKDSLFYVNRYLIVTITLSEKKLSCIDNCFIKFYVLCDIICKLCLQCDKV
ncbi:MAG: hypothetical protein JWQ34_1007 [Mucilaginibacter sp.]|jgi:hypothetical protein|nr:hypothetical protein [Mucilaginibacter sp.]